MDLPKLEIVEGDVVKVQLTSQTDVAGRSGVRAKDKTLISSKVSNHMRVFLNGADGKARDFQFVNSTVAVREGNHVAVVRAKPKGPGPWLLIALYNLTTDKREEQIGAFAKAARQQWLSARWRAVFWSLGVTTVYGPISEVFHFARGRGWGVALALGVLVYPVAWTIGALTDWLVTPPRQREAERALRLAIDEQMSRAKRAPSSAPSAPAPRGEEKT